MVGSLLHKIISTPEKRLQELHFLLERYLKVDAIEEKLEVLNESLEVKNFLKSPSLMRSFLYGLSPECELVLKSVIAIGQAEKIFYQPSIEGVRNLLTQLLPVEKFYREIGGIVGYQWLVLKLLADPVKKKQDDEVYLKPEGTNISCDTEEVREAILAGISALPHFAEIYPVGGAADRLALFDEVTGEPLPAARLLFLGRTLLEGLIRDLQAREYLYFKLFGKQCRTPVAMMTSQEKNNHHHMIAICEEHAWFGRPKESFRFFCQPLVPTVNREGNWCLQSPMHLLLKPGGHGVIWKLARDEGILSWFQECSRSKALIRQINNPIAGLDYGLSAFTGIGWKRDKKFGFASCPRVVKAQEGTNVLIEKKVEGAFRYVLTSIEYSEFKQHPHLDEPISEHSPFTLFSSNTNILYVDLSAIQEAISRCPFPGKMVNFKKATFQTETCQIKEEVVARVESMMQNIAEAFEQEFSEPLEPASTDQLPSFITYHHRHKTISTAKQASLVGKPWMETPEGCFFDYMINMEELLSQHCLINLPASFLEKEGIFQPAYFCWIDPALGPFYSIIGQKICGGRFSFGCELDLEIVDLHVENLNLSGSLSIKAMNSRGHLDEKGILTYSNCTGKCILKNVTVKNQGIDFTAPNVYWKKELHYKERCSILIEGSGEFYADSISFEDNVSIIVKEGFRVTAYEKEGKVVFLEEKIDCPSWTWEYSMDAKTHSLKLSAIYSPYAHRS